jgi:penicillin-binding protein-related factor A (putative recombinase)
MRLEAPTEKMIETSILDWLALKRVGHFWKNNSVGVFDPIKKAYRKSNSPHSERGSSDILGCVGGKFVAIEVKRNTKSALSDNQKIFMSNIKRSGGIAFVATSIDDVIRSFHDFGFDI